MVEKLFVFLYLLYTHKIMPLVLSKDCAFGTNFFQIKYANNFQRFLVQ